MFEPRTHYVPPARRTPPPFDDEEAVIRVRGALSDCGRFRPKFLEVF